VLFLKKMC